jgi:hypothetical protein
MQKPRKPAGFNTSSEPKDVDDANDVARVDSTGFQGKSTAGEFQFLGGEE